MGKVKRGPSKRTIRKLCAELERNGNAARAERLCRVYRGAVKGWGVTRPELGEALKRGRDRGVVARLEEYEAATRELVRLQTRAAEKSRLLCAELARFSWGEVTEKLCELADLTEEIRIARGREKRAARTARRL